MNVYALDSNIISFYLKGNTTVIKCIEKAINDDNKIVIPPIVYYEVKRGLKFINATKKMKEFETLCKLFPVGELGDYLIEKSIDIYIQERKATQKMRIYLSQFFVFITIIF